MIVVAQSGFLFFRVKTIELTKFFFFCSPVFFLRDRAELPRGFFCVASELNAKMKVVWPVKKLTGFKDLVHKTVATTASDLLTNTYKSCENLREDLQQLGIQHCQFGSQQDWEKLNEMEELWLLVGLFAALDPEEPWRLRAETSFPTQQENTHLATLPVLGSSPNEIYFLQVTTNVTNRNRVIELYQRIQTSLREPLTTCETVAATAAEKPGEQEAWEEVFGCLAFIGLLSRWARNKKE